MKLTILFSKGEEFFIGSIKEIPSVLTQGETIEEAKATCHGYFTIIPGGHPK